MIEVKLDTSKVPDLVGERFRKYDRSYLDNQCSKKYGTEWKE